MSQTASFTHLDSTSEVSQYRDSFSLAGTFPRWATVVKEHSGGLRNRAPNVAVPSVFETDCRPTQRSPPNGGRAVDRTRAALLVAGYGLASRPIAALTPFRGEIIDRLQLDATSVALSGDGCGGGNRTVVPNGYEPASPLGPCREDSNGATHFAQMFSAGPSEKKSTGRTSGFISNRSRGEAYSVRRLGHGPLHSGKNGSGRQWSSQQDHGRPCPGPPRCDLGRGCRSRTQFGENRNESWGSRYCRQLQTAWRERALSPVTLSAGTSTGS